MNNSLMLKGEIEIISYNPDGSIENKWNYKNLITDRGFDYLCKIIGGDKGGINKIALGDSGVSATVNDLALYNKLILVNANRDYSFTKKVKFLGVVPENTFQTTVFYREGGLVYKSTTEEVLITRVVFPDTVYQKPANSLSISYSITLQ